MIRIITIYWVLKHNVQLCCSTLKSLLSQMSNRQYLHILHMCQTYKIAYWQNQGGGVIWCVSFHVHRSGYPMSCLGDTLAYWRCRTSYAFCGGPACPASLFCQQYHHSHDIICIIFWFLSHSGWNAPSLGYSSDKLSLTLMITSWFLPIVASDVCWLWSFLDSSHVKIMISC